MTPRNLFIGAGIYNWNTAFGGTRPPGPGDFVNIYPSPPLYKQAVLTTEPDAIGNLRIRFQPPNLLGDKNLNGLFVLQGSGLNVTGSINGTPARYLSAAYSTLYPGAVGKLSGGVVIDGGDWSASYVGGMSLEAGQLSVSGTWSGGGMIGGTASAAYFSGSVYGGVLQAGTANGIFISGGTVTANAAESVAYVGRGVLNTGSLSVTNYGFIGMTVGRAGTVALSDGIIIAPATYSASNGVVLDGQGARLSAASLSVQNGKFIVDPGGSVSISGSGTIGGTAPGGLIVAGGSGTAGAAAFGGSLYVGASPGSGTAELIDGGSLSASSVELGAAANSSGLLGIYSGTVTVTNGVTIGDMGTATATIAGGTLTAGSLGVAIGGGYGTVAVSGGYVGVGGVLNLGYPGQFLISGGSLHAGTIDVGNGPSTAEPKPVRQLPVLSLTAGSVSAQGISINTGRVVIGAGGTLSSTDTIALNSGTVLVVSGGSVSSGGDLLVGQNGAGTVLVDGANAVLNVNADMIIGQDGTGVLSLSNSGALNVTGTLQLGSANGTGSVTDAGGDPARHFGALAINNGVANVAAGGGNPWLVAGGINIGGVANVNGTLNLPQTATVVAGNEQVTIGGAGTGNLNLDENALFDASGVEVTVGDQSGSSGTVTVYGDGALLEAGTLTVGNSGSADLTVSGGGELQVAGMLTVGDNTSSTIIASVNIADVGTSADVGGVSVGGNGTGTLTIANADLTVTGDGSVGDESEGAGTMSVDGGSADVSGTLTVGDSGNGLLIVGLGGTLTADSLAIASISSGKGEVDVNNESSVSSKDMSVGSAGKATLKLTGGQVTTTGDVNIAEQVKGSVQSVTVDQQSLWTVGGTFTDAAAGIATVTIKGASLLAVNGDIVVGDQAGAGGVLAVSGTLVTGGSTIASEISYADVLKVGNAGDGSLTVQQGGEVVTATGGTGEIDIAIAAGETSTATVTGAGSLLQGNSLAVGGNIDAAGGQGKLTVSSSGEVLVSDAHVWSTGAIKLSGGTLATDPLTIDAGGAVNGAGLVSGAITDDGKITASSGVLTLSGAVGGSGALDIGSSGTLSLSGSVAGSVALEFSGQGGTLRLATSIGANMQAPIADFRPGDTIALAGQSVDGFSYDTSINALTLNGDGGANVSVTLSGSYSQSSFALSNGVVVMPCFVTGSRIATPLGDMPVERLREGDRVQVMLHGGDQPIVWIGHRVVDCRRHPRPTSVWPVRICAGAFGYGQPRRALWLSPDHAVFVHGVLIPVKHLIDGVAIVQVAVDEVAYFHIELPRHDVVRADGLAVETYLDTGDRSNFANGGGAIRLYPDFATAVWEARGAAPLAVTGPQLEAARRIIATHRRAGRQAGGASLD
jgi:collagen type I/II/III/V/XI/XXIV/XXVII alpha